MTQTNAQTGAAREVRRVDRAELERAAAEAAAVRARVKWEVDLGAGSWVAYTAEATAQLEAAFSDAAHDSSIGSLSTISEISSCGEMVAMLNVQAAS